MTEGHYSDWLFMQGIYKNMLKRLSLLAVLLAGLLGANAAYAFDIDIADATTPDEAAVDQTIAVFISSPQSSSVTVDYALTGGTATAGDDFTASTGQITFNASETVKHIPVPILADTLDEDDETVIITLSNPTSGTLVDTQAVLTITDDDNPPQLSILDNSTSESAGSFTLAATLDTPSSKQVSVGWRAIGNTATDGADFTASSGTLTFAPNSVSENITISLIGDSLDEDDETVTISLYNAVNASIDNDTAILTLSDDDNPPSISIADLTTTDENTANIILSLSAPSAKSVVVAASTNPVTASDPADYTATSTNITFNPGSTQETLSIALVNDSLDEVDETFEVALSSPVNASISDNLSEVTITDDDAPPSVAVSDASAVDDNTTLAANVTLSAASALQIEVDYATADGTAIAGQDYTTTSGTLTFAPGQTSLSVAIPILGDVIDEEDETFTLNLSSPDNASISTAQATMTITDNDGAPTISISDNSTADESAGSTTLSVSLSTASERSITVAYATSDSTASAGSDYTSTSGTLTFAPSVTTQTISVPILADSKDEDNETISVNLSNPSNASINDGLGVLTITDDDNPPTITIDDLTTPNEASVNQTISVRLSAESQLPVSVAYATANGDAIAGSDYSTASGTVNFTPGTTVQTIIVAIMDDAIDETNETFTIALSSPVNASLSDNSSTITITDDEGLPSLSVASASVVDDNTTLAANVTLSAASALQIEVDYATADGTAIAGQDYTTTSGTLTFAPGQTSLSVAIPILGDVIDEEDETFTLNLSSPDNASISTAQATMTITDNDGAPTISISDNSTADESAAIANLTVSLSAASEKTVTVSYTTSDGTASAGSDYTASANSLTFAAGSTSQTIPIAVLADNADENDETIIVTLSNPAEATISDDTGVLTITDDDNQPSISIADATTANEVAVSQNVTLTLSAASELPVTVDWTTQNGSAVAGDDYSADNGSVSFAAGSTSQTVSIHIMSDDIDETDETFTIALSNPVNANLSDNSSTVTITDDDTLAITISDNSTTEDNTTIQTIVSLSNPSSSVITVDYATQDTSAAAGADYTAASNTLSFAPGVTSQSVSVIILDDSAQEGTETLAINLSNATGGATITDAQGVVTILDDDGSADLTIADVSASEASGSAIATVSLSYAMPIAVTVDYQTADNSALAGADYTADNGTLTFAAGITSQTITLALLSDSTYEGDENFTLNLSNAVNASLTDNQAVITISEDDTPLTTDETEEIRQNIVFGKNSIARAETQFMNRVLARNRNMMFAGTPQNTQPKLSFQNLALDWDEHRGNLDAIFSLDDLSSDGSRNISWENAISHSKNGSGVKNTTVSSALNFSHRLSDNMMFGYILGFGYSDTAMSGSMTGSNKSRSASIGLYSSYKIQESLILDLMAAQTYENNTLNSTIGSKTIDGDFDRTSTVFSSSLQGVFKFATAEIRPTFTYSAGKSVFTNAYFDITQAGLTSSQQIDFGTDEYYALSFEPELKLLIGSPAQLIRPSGFNMLKLRPKYFCEKYDSDSEDRCGRGMGLTLANHHPSYHYNQDLSFDYEKIANTKSYSLRYKRTY